MGMLHQSRASISSELSLWFSGFAIVLVIFLSEGIYLFASDALTKQISLRLNDMATEVASRLDEGMYERYREIENLSRRQDVFGPDVDDQTVEKMLTDISAGFPHYTWMGVTDSAGVVRASTRGLLRGVEVTKRPWYKNALGGINVGDVHEANLLAAILRSPQSEPLRFVDFSFPVGVGGKKAGVFGVHMNWAWASEVERSVMTSAKKMGDVEALIIGRDDRVILGPTSLVGTYMPTKSLLNQKAAAASGELSNLIENEEFILGSATTRGVHQYPGLGWTVVVRQRTSEAFLPVQRLRNAVLTLGLGMTFMFFLIGRYSARRITQPIRLLANSAQNIAEGLDLTLTTPEKSYKELSYLAESMEALITAKSNHERELVEMNASLEGRVTERTHKLQVSKARLRTITNSIPVLIAYVNRNLVYEFCNNAYEQWHNIEAGSAIGKSVRSVIGPKMFSAVESQIASALRDEHVSFELPAYQNNAERYLSVSYIPESEHGNLVGFYVVGQDITAAKQRQLALEHEVVHDSLTKLPNRLGCVLAINAAIERAKRSQTALAVMFLDLNKFKAINDTYGHAIGDEVLMCFAARVREAVRETDTVCRLAGDEFVVIAENLVDGVANATQIAKHIVESLTSPMAIRGFDQAVTTSIGVVVHHRGPTTAEVLLKCADVAMYASKASKAAYTLYSPEESVDV